MSAALILTVEDKKIFIRDDKTREFIFPETTYVDEIFECVTTWRRNAKEYANIPIYALCVTENTLTDEDQAKLYELGVVYLEHTSRHKVHTPYCNVINTGIWCEENLQHIDTFFHIDLDMLVLPLANLKRLADMAEQGPVVGIYDADSLGFESRISIHKKLDMDAYKAFETCLVVSKREDFFYKTWRQELDILYSKEEVWTELTDSERRELEEVIIDFIHHDKTMNIIPVEHYSIGHGYPIPESVNRTTIDHYCFLHQHAYAPDTHEALIDYNKRRAALCSSQK